MKSQTTKTVTLSVIGIAISVAFLIGLQGRSASRYYSCHYQQGVAYARCVPIGDSGGSCYGYYDLRGSNIHDGINTNNDHSATCEGFVPGNEVYFTKDGDLSS